MNPSRPHRIDLGSLVCESVIDRLRRENPAAVGELETSRGTLLHVATARDVLYLPDLRLQILDGGVVPTEGIVDPWNLPFEQKSNFNGRGKRYDFEFRTEVVDDDVCILSNLYSHNFSHWIDELLKVTILEQSGFTGRYVLSHLPDFSFDFLELLGIARSRLLVEVSGPTVFRSAKYATNLSFLNLRPCPEIFSELRVALLSSCVATPSPYGKRLWLERGANVNDSDRRIVNPDEVDATLERYGFEKVDIGSLPLRQQIAAARDAEAISGVHGSAFAHCMFMDTGSTVIECFSPNYLNGYSFEMCRVLKHYYFLVVDSHSRYELYPHGNGVRVPRPQLELALQKLDQLRRVAS